MDRHDEERRPPDVAESMRRLGRDDQHRVRSQLDDGIASRPAAFSLEQEERLGVRMRMELDEAARQSAHDEHRDVDACALRSFEEEGGRALVESQVVEVERRGAVHGRYSTASSAETSSSGASCST